jgi:cation-transporting ATPase E
VLRFAVPSGVIAGLVVLVSYVLAKTEPALKALEAAGRCSGPESGVPADVTCWHPGTGATLALLTTFFWILVVLARPFRRWKVALIGSMVLLTALAFLLPIGQRFFDFSLSPTLLWQSLLVGVVGAVGVELVYRFEPSLRGAAGS